MIYEERKKIGLSLPSSYLALPVELYPMLATEQVTTLFVHGAWHQPAHFVPIMAKLESNGMHCICPQQPTYNVSSQDMRTTTMYKDASAIRKVLDELIIEQERYVMVVLHSYGGLVGTQATDASLGVKQRASQGKMGGVVRLVYMCAFLMAPNTSLGDAFGGRLPPFIKEEVGLVFNIYTIVIARPR